MLLENTVTKPVFVSSRYTHDTSSCLIHICCVLIPYGHRFVDFCLMIILLISFVSLFLPSTNSIPVSSFVPVAAAASRWRSSAPSGHRNPKPCNKNNYIGVGDRRPRSLYDVGYVRCHRDADHFAQSVQSQFAA